MLLSLDSCNKIVKFISRTNILILVMFMNENYARTEKDYHKLGSKGEIGVRIKSNPLFPEYERFMNAGRYSKALEIAVKLRSRYHISETDMVAKEFYSKNPNISEAREYSDTKQRVMTRIKESKDHYLESLLSEE